MALAIENSTMNTKAQAQKSFIRTKSYSVLKIKKAIQLIIVLCTVLMIGSQPARANPALVFDMKSDLVIYSEEADRLWHPASLTKLMTAYLVFEALKAKKVTMESKLINSANARAQPPSKIGLPLNATMKLKDAIEILIVKSANDVAVMPRITPQDSPVRAATRRRDPGQR